MSACRRLFVSSQGSPIGENSDIHKALFCWRRWFGGGSTIFIPWSNRVARWPRWPCHWGKVEDCQVDLGSTSAPFMSLGGWATYYGTGVTSCSTVPTFVWVCNLDDVPGQPCKNWAISCEMCPVSLTSAHSLRSIFWFLDLPTHSRCSLRLWAISNCKNLLC